MTYLQARRVQGFGQEARNGERRRCGGGMKGCAGESSGRACFRNGGMWRSAAAIFGWARRRGDVFRTRLVAGPRLGLLSTSLEIRCWAVGGRLPGSLWRAVAVGEVHGEWNISHVVFRRIGPVGGRVSRVLILPPAAWCSFMVVLLLLLLLLLYLQRRLLLLLRWLLHHAGRGRQREIERGREQRTSQFEWKGRMRERNVERKELSGAKRRTYTCPSQAPRIKVGWVDVSLSAGGGCC